MNKLRCKVADLVAFTAVPFAVVAALIVLLSCKIEGDEGG